MDCISKRSEFERCYNNGSVLGSSTYGIIQLINNRRDILNEEVGKKLLIDSLDIKWVSPIPPDYLEYYDNDFLRILGLKEWTDSKKPLQQFWPKNGPHWDALGYRIKNDNFIDKIFLVEAKSRIPEMFSDISVEIKSDSLEFIKKTLDEVKGKIRPYCGEDQYIGDWTKVFYQYANRLAHLYYLRVLNNLDAYLIYVYFINDPYWGNNGVSSKERWEGIISTVKNYLGLMHGMHRLSDYVLDVFLEYKNIL